MRPFTGLSTLISFALALTVLARPAAGQDASNVPAISSRYFEAGSAKVAVTGAAKYEGEVPINDKASFGDGEMTWIQYGVSGAEDLNVLLIFGGDGYGIIVGKGKKTSVAEADRCTGKTTVTAALVSGQYTCTGVTWYDGATGKMVTVGVKVEFTAKTKTD